MKTRLLLAVIAMAIGFTLPIFAQEQKTVDPKMRQEVEAIEMKLQEAYNNRDVATISALHTQDAVEVRAAGGGTRAGVFSGRQALEKMFAADFASSPGKMVNTIVQVYAIDENNICAIANTSVGTRWKAYTVTAYVRALDGTWKIHMTYVNPL
jgi:ketosteroid isomerase-like protein